jgi:pyruvate dehydrogenase E1 component
MNTLQCRKGAEEGIVKGMYKLIESKTPAIRLLGSGSILNESIRAKSILIIMELNLKYGVLQVLIY